MAFPQSLDEIRERLDRLDQQARDLCAENAWLREKSRDLLARIRRDRLRGEKE